MRSISINQPRVIRPVADLQPDNRFCTRCGKPLVNDFAYLELDQRTDAYHDFGNVPEDKSQGWFPFGIQCARILNAQTASSRHPWPEIEDV